MQFWILKSIRVRKVKWPLSFSKSLWVTSSKWLHWKAASLQEETSFVTDSKSKEIKHKVVLTAKIEETWKTDKYSCKICDSIKRWSSWNKKFLQISDSILFCIALITPLNTDYSSVQPEILHFWLFANFLVELLSCSGGRLSIPLLEKHSGKF